MSAERYATPPLAQCPVEALPARSRMDAHLKKMGAVWK